MLSIGDLTGVLLAILFSIYMAWMVYLSWRRPKKLEEIMLSFLDIDQETVSRRINIMAIFGPIIWLFSLVIVIIAVRVSIYGPY